MIKNCDDWCDFAPIEQCPLERDEESRDKAIRSMIYNANRTEHQHADRLRKNREAYANLSIVEKKLLNKRKYEFDKIRMEEDPEYKKKRAKYFIEYQRRRHEKTSQQS